MYVFLVPIPQKLLGCHYILIVADVHKLESEEQIFSTRVGLSRLPEREYVSASQGHWSGGLGHPAITL